MPIDPLIASGGTPIKIENPMNRMAALMQLQRDTDASAADQMRISQGRLDQADEQAHRQAVIDSGGDQSKLMQLLQGKGLYKPMAALQKTNLEADKSKADLSKTNQESIGLALTNTAKFVPGIQSADGAATYLRGLYADPLLGPAVARMKPLEQAIQEIPQDPQGLEHWKLSHGNMTPEKFVELTAPKIDYKNDGKTLIPIQSNSLAPGYTTPQPIQMKTTPDADLQATTSRQNNAATVSASLANAGATREVAYATRDAARIQTGFANEQGLRKEFEGLPEVKNYKQAYPAYAAIKDAASRNTTQSDINIVYGLAKLYDPTSVVREGEYATVANSPNIPEKVKGYAQYLAGGGRLSPETKKQILAEAEGRIGTYSAEAKKAKGSYEGIATKRGMDPASVFADMGDMTASPQAPKPAARTVVQTGTHNGKKVVKYSDGTVEYAN